MRGGEGRAEKSSKGEGDVRDGVGMGKEGGRVGPQVKAWPPELFSWRRRCGKRILDFLLVLIELKNINQRT